LFADLANDPARPSLMRVYVEKIELPSVPTDQDLVVKIKFRKRELIKKTDGRSLGQDMCEFVLSYHSHKFDALKVLCWSQDVLLLRSGAYTLFAPGAP
jgi:hypothetical protein